MSVNFGGRTIIKPGAYSQVDVEGMIPISIGGLRVLAMLGEADRGEPQTIKWFNNPSNAKKYFQNGDLLTGLQIAWNPAPVIPGADLIAAIRVNPATQASHILQDTTPADAIILTAKDWGIIALTVTVTDHTGDRSITVSDGVTTETTGTYDNNAAIIADINENFTLVTAEIASGTPTLVVAASSTPFGTAGTNPAPVQSDWETCVDLLRTEGIQGVIPVTEDAAVHVYTLDHAIEMSQLKIKKERRIFVGHDLGETVSDITTRAGNLNNHRALLVTPGIMRHNANGEVVTLPSVYTACAIAGMWVGAEFNYPLTFDYINALGLETKYELADIETLIQGGVLVVESVIGKGYRIVQAVTTHISSDNPVYRELSISSLADIMSIELRDTLEELYVGKPYTNDTKESIKNTTISKLNLFVRNGWLIESEAGDPPYRNINIFKEGVAISVEWEGSPSVPNNYVFITSSFTL